MTDETTHMDTHPVFACAECCEAWEPDSSEIRVMGRGDGTFTADCPRNEEHARMTAEGHFEACDDPNCPDVVRHFSEQAGPFTIGGCHDG